MGYDAQGELRAAVCDKEPCGVANGVALGLPKAFQAWRDKTLLLLLGQEREPVSVVLDRNNVSVAARFDSGRNFVELFGLEGGMPTRVSVPRPRLAEVLRALGVDPSQAGVEV